MATTKRAKNDVKADVRKLADLVQREVDAGANSVDRAADVCVRGVGQIRLPRVQAGADVGVNRVHADGAHSNQDLARADGRQRRLLDLQDLGAAELAHNDRFHDERFYVSSD